MPWRAPPVEGAGTSAGTGAGRTRTGPIRTGRVRAGRVSDGGRRGHLSVTFPEWLVVSPKVARAIAVRGPVVALETAVLALGLPYPENLDTFQAMALEVEKTGAVPAPIALDDGRVHVGLDPGLIERLARSGESPEGGSRGAAGGRSSSRGEGGGGGRRAEKVARRDVGRVLATRALGATTVSATLAMAIQTGIPIMATGGIGGVHIGAPPGGHLDVSADLVTLADCPGIVVCAGVKTICDPSATLERLESLSVPVVGYHTERFPHFYGGVTDLVVPVVRSPAQVLACWREHLRTGQRSALLVTAALDGREALDPVWLDGLVRSATARARREHVRGPLLTPYLLAALARASKGRTVQANRALLLANARIAARIALAAA